MLNKNCNKVTGRESVDLEQICNDLDCLSGIYPEVSLEEIVTPKNDNGREVFACVDRVISYLDDKVVSLKGLDSNTGPADVIKRIEQQYRQVAEGAPEGEYRERKVKFAIGVSLYIKLVDARKFNTPETLQNHFYESLKGREGALLNILYLQFGCFPFTPGWSSDLDKLSHGRIVEMVYAISDLTPYKNMLTSEDTTVFSLLNMGFVCDESMTLLINKTGFN